MFLSLEEPGGDKHVTLFCRNFKGEKHYGKKGYFAFDTECGKFSYAARTANKCLGQAIGRGNLDAISIMPNQFIWQGTSGWESWTNDYVLVLRHALHVASELKLPLHLQTVVLNKVLHAAMAQGIKFDWTKAKPVKKLHPGGEMRSINEQIENGEFVVLSNVVIPEALTVITITAYEEAEQKRIDAMFSQN